MNGFLDSAVHTYIIYYVFTNYLDFNKNIITKIVWPLWLKPNYYLLCHWFNDWAVAKFTIMSLIHLSTQELLINFYWKQFNDPPLTIQFYNWHQVIFILNPFLVANDLTRITKLKNLLKCGELWSPLLRLLHQIKSYKVSLNF